MKAYVIKSNNDKLYLSNSLFYKWTNDFCEARIETDRKDMEQILVQVYRRLCTGKIVEITISEGDLEKELAIIKRALLKASKEAFGNKASFVSSNYPKKITNPEEYAEYLIFETESEVKNGN